MCKKCANMCNNVQISVSLIQTCAKMCKIVRNVRECAKMCGFLSNLMTFKQCFLLGPKHLLDTMHVKLSPLSSSLHIKLSPSVHSLLKWKQVAVELFKYMTKKPTNAELM